MNKESSFLKKYKNLVGYDYQTRFLDLNEQKELKFIDKSVIFDGGYLEAEKKVGVSGSTNDNIITLVKVNYNDNFKKLRHKDILGALFSLQIDPSLFGDIVSLDGDYYIFILKDYLEFFKEEFVQVSNLKVNLVEVEDIPRTFDDFGVDKLFFVASLRLDLILAESFNLSRSEAKKMVENEMIRVNHKLIDNPAFNLELGDIVSVMRKGRFKLKEIKGVSKRDKLIITLRIYK